MPIAADALANDEGADKCHEEHQNAGHRDGDSRHVHALGHSGAAVRRGITAVSAVTEGRSRAASRFDDYEFFRGCCMRHGSSLALAGLGYEFWREILGHKVVGY